MKVKVLTDLSGPRGAISAGSVISDDDTLAAELLARKVAVEVKERKPSQAKAASSAAEGS